MNQELREVPLHQVVPNPNQPRRRFNERSLQELAQSIRSQGILQPLVVRERAQDHYELVAGERRWRALNLLEAETVPVLVRKVSDQELLEVALLENIQREDLSPIEEAQAYQDLLRMYACTQNELARRLGRDRSTIANQLRLLQLPEAIQQDVEAGRLSSGHARALLGLPGAASQLHLREQILRQAWNVRQTEKAVKAEQARWASLFRTPGSSRSTPQTSESTQIHLQSLEEEFSRHLRTKVSIHFHSGQGRIELHYSSLEEFERLQALLLTP